MKGKLLYFFCISGIAIAMLFFFEVLLRILYSNRLSTIKPVYKFHPDYLITLNPNIEKIYCRTEENGGDCIRWKTNTDAFRGNELKKNPGIRIMVYGDSNIQARFSWLKNTFPEQLRQELRKYVSKDIEVINAGILGFGPDQALMKFAQEIDIYDPNIVIFHIFVHNDFGDIIRNRLFEIDSTGALIKTNFKRTPDREILPKPLSSLFIVRGVRKMKSEIQKWIAVDDSSSENPDQLLEHFLTLTAREYAVYKQSKPKVFSHFADHYDFDIALYPESESAKEKVLLMEAILKQAKMLADSRGVKLVVMIQPSPIDLTKNSQPNYQKLSEYKNYKNDRLTSIVENIVNKNQIDGINLFQVFSQNHPEHLFFKGSNRHWNDAGQKLAAKEVAKSLIQKGFIR